MFCERAGFRVPRWRDRLVLDTSDPRVKRETGPAHGWVLPRDALIPVPSFAPRFQRLLVAGYSWINLSIYGLFGGDLVIGLELPRDPAGVPAGSTSVNYSGPSLDPTGEPDWHLRLTMAP